MSYGNAPTDGLALIATGHRPKLALGGNASQGTMDHYLMQDQEEIDISIACTRVNLKRQLK